MEFKFPSGISDVNKSTLRLVRDFSTVVQILILVVVVDNTMASTTTTSDKGGGPASSSPLTTPSLMNFLRAEVTRGYALELEEERFQSRRDKVYMFLIVPAEVERLMGYGFFQCMDAFLYLLTILPLRVAYSLGRRLFVDGPRRSLQRLLRGRDSSPSHYRRLRLSSAEVCDVLKVVVLVSVVYLFLFIDTSVLYHVVKSQSVIKLYIFFNMLEVGDRLFASFVQDTIDALFLTATESNSTSKRHHGRRQMSVGSHLLLVMFAVFGHALVILLQGTTLSVAINASNRALLTVMMSNNFVELKGAVFKKFDKINLFQVSCSDVRERFHLVVLLLIVCLQTMREYSWEEARFWVLFPDCLMVLLAEVGVDWVKHCFITRFNELDAEVYREYTLSLAYDLAQTKQRGRAFSDHSDMVGRRLGFVPLPLAVVLIRILRPCFPTPPVLTFATLLLTLLAFLALASFRTVSSILLLGKACDLIDHHTLTQQQQTTPPGTATMSPFASPVKLVKEERFSPPPPPPQGTIDDDDPFLSAHEDENEKKQRDILSELLLRNRRRCAAAASATAAASGDSQKFARSMSISGGMSESDGRHLSALACKEESGNCSSSDNKGAGGGGPGAGGGSADWCGLEPFGRLLPANSAVSVLSVQFNEEMVRANNAAAAAAAAAESESTAGMHQRKHSLGSCLVDSEQVLSYSNSNDNAAVTAPDVVTIKTEPNTACGVGAGAAEEEVSEFQSNYADTVTAVMADLSLRSSSGQEETEESDVDNNQASPRSPTTRSQQQQCRSPLSTSPVTATVEKRVKKKSLTGWLKESLSGSNIGNIGSSSSSNSNNNAAVGGGSANKSENKEADENK